MNFSAFLKQNLASHGWRLVFERLDTCAIAGQVVGTWRVASLTPPVGRQVLIEQRVQGYYEDNYYNLGWTNYQRIVSYPEGMFLDPRPRVILGDQQPWEVFRALSWFRDPVAVAEVDANFVHSHGLDSFDPTKFTDWQGLDTRWDATAGAREMLEFSLPTLDDRKAHLLACALIKSLPLGMLIESNRHAADMLERYALEQIPRREFKKAAKASRLDWLARLGPQELALRAIDEMLGEDPVLGDRKAADIIRELVAQPFRQLTFKHRWLFGNGAAGNQVLRAIDAMGDYASLPILADALEEGGCQEPRLLEHCRQPGPHLRGCWLVDLLMGRAGS